MNKKTVFEIFAAYVAMVVAFCAMSVLAWMIPHEYTDDNIRESLTILSEEGRFPLTGGVLLWGKDNISDGTMYNIAVSGYDMTPIEAAIREPRTYEGDEYTHAAEYGLRTLDTQNGSVARIDYGRYWNGYQLPLRLWSMLLSIKGMRILNSIVLWGLLLITSVWLYRRYGRTVGICWFVAFVLVGFPAVPLSLQYTSNYYVMFISVLLMLWRPKLMESLVSFFIIGGCTSFFDLMSTPMITISLPLAVVVMANHGKTTYQKLFELMISWGAGYAAIWSTKWAITSISAKTDTIDLVFQGAYTIFNFLPEGIYYKYFAVTVGLLSMALIGFVTIYVLGRSRMNKRYATQLLCVGIVPYVWYIILLGHTCHHIFFAYRALTVTALCGLLILFTRKSVEYE